MPTTKEDYFKARDKYNYTTVLTMYAIRENKNVIGRTKKALATYNSTKTNKTTEAESKVEAEYDAILNKMLENLKFERIYEGAYSTIMSSDNDFLTKLSENLDLISTVIEAIETEHVAQTKTETKAKTVAKAVLTKMLEKLYLANEATREAKVVEMNANYDKHLTKKYFYLSYV